MRIKSLLSLVLAGTLLVACNTEKKGANDGLTDLEGGLTGGGVLKVNEIENFRSLFPASITDIYSQHIASQVYQGLTKLNSRTLEVEPCLAESFTSNDDATVWTFSLRKGVMFHDDACFEGGKGREFTAHDAKYCLDNICSNMTGNKHFELLSSRVKGAREHHAASSSEGRVEGGVSGIEVVDDYTLRITLNESVANLDKILTHVGLAFYPEEAFKKYGADMRTHTVGTGPFMLKSVKENDMVFLERNPNYWETDEHGNQLPYLEGVKFSFIKEKKLEMMEFRKGELDFIYQVPVEEVPNLMKELADVQAGQRNDFVTQVTNALDVQYYGFLNTHEVFSDVRVRKAFNMAIDRNDLIDNTLNGEGEAAEFGFVAPMEGYPSDSINGHEFNVEEARRLLDEAGYPSGQGFPEITLNFNSGGRINDLVAAAIQAQLRSNLGVSIKINPLPMDQHQTLLEAGKVAMWRLGWIADYPDPENFLDMFHSRHVPEDPTESTARNTFRYVNPEFDALLEKAQGTTDQEERMRLLAQCDQMVVDEAVVMPLYYDHVIRLVKKYVKNLPINPMEYRDFTRVYKDKKEVAKLDDKK